MKDAELWSEVTNTWAVQSAAVAGLGGTVSKETVLEIIKILGDCTGRILVSGCGTSAAAARKIAHSLCCVERPACYLNPSDAVHGGLGLLQAGDVFILISKGGNTTELLSMVPAAKTKRATLIGVSENPESVLAKQADVFLKVKVDKEPCPFNMLATASTMAVVAVFDAICIALMHYTHYTREQFAVIHPGGAVGARLLKGEE